MRIEVAKSAGFCFGAKRAVDMVQELLHRGEKAATLGALLHNPQLVEELEAKGVKVVDAPRDTPEGHVLVLRSHGVTLEVEREIERLGAREGHPEVRGTVSHCKGPYFVCQDHSELQNLLKDHAELTNVPIAAAAQTTFHMGEWEKCLETLKKVCTNAAVFDTICNATAKRQKEALDLAGKCDVMIVIGGRDSSNTAKLGDICARQCRTYLIEKASELPTFPAGLSVGITAGASTPASIIKEVLVTMAEVNSTEQNFEEMLEESLKSMNTDEKVHGVVVGISPTEVYVDVGRKQAGFIPAVELSNDPTAKPEDIVKMGDEMELLIMKTNDQEGTIMLSKRRVDAMRGWDIIQTALENNEVLEGKVIEVVKGGVIVLWDGMRVFVPASQATVSRGEDLNALQGQEVRFRVIEVDRKRRRAVGSIRSVLREERKAAQAKFWEQVEEGQEFTGKVKSLTNFGAFVDLGGVDGMIHISELSWNRVKHPSEVVKVGDTVNVYVKGLDRENGKISLGYRRQEDNPWVKLEQEFPAGTVCEAKVVGMTDFGAFASVIPGIDGLIHISQIADHRIDKPQDVLKVGDVVKVKITDVDLERHRVSLSIRAVLEDEQAAAAAEEAPADEVVFSTEDESSEE